jgi:hypothetical protein
MIFSRQSTTIFLALIANAGALSTPAQSKPFVNKAVPGLENGMDYTTLGSSDLEVSRVCMGTMTFGEVSNLIFFSSAQMLKLPLLLCQSSQIW